MPTPPKCSCDEPRVHANPRRAGWCANCLLEFDPEWLSNNATVKEFLDRLERGAFPGKPPERWEEFRLRCERREFAGRDQFGLAYLVRDNSQEAQEEALDLCVYMHLALLRARRDELDEEWAVALSAAYHAFLAYNFSADLAAKRRGAP